MNDFFGFVNNKTFGFNCSYLFERSSNMNLSGADEKSLKSYLFTTFSIFFWELTESTYMNAIESCGNTW